MKKIMFYTGMIGMSGILGRIMSLNSVMLHVIGTGLLLLIIYLAVPIIYLNYKLRNVSESVDLVHVELMPKSRSDRFKKLFYAGGAVAIFISIIFPQVFANMAIIVILLLVGSYLPIILRGNIWESDEVIESGENE